jgi:hypothetical protein
VPAPATGETPVAERRTWFDSVQEGEPKLESILAVVGVADSVSSGISSRPGPAPFFSMVLKSIVVLGYSYAVHADKNRRRSIALVIVLLGQWSAVRPSSDIAAIGPNPVHDDRKVYARPRLWRVACQFVSPARGPSSSGLRRGHLDKRALGRLRGDIRVRGGHRSSRCAQWCRAHATGGAGGQAEMRTDQTDRRKRARSSDYCDVNQGDHNTNSRNRHQPPEQPDRSGLGPEWSSRGERAIAPRRTERDLRRCVRSAPHFASARS